jgi:hypothetical protein
LCLLFLITYQHSKNHLSYKAEFSLQKGWPDKMRTTVLDLILTLRHRVLC